MWDIHTVDETPSTQDALRDDMREYRVVRTLSQSKGRGRNTGRTWDFLPGNLAFSFAVKAARPDVGSLALVAGLALAQAVNHPNAQLKWPNDLLLDGKKCAGILCEIERDCACVGIGVNIADAPEGFAALGQGYEAEALMHAILEAFAPLYARWQTEGFAPLKQGWLDHALPIGTSITTSGQSGQFTGIDNQGALLLRDANGRIRTLMTGEVDVTGH